MTNTPGLNIPGLNLEEKQLDELKRRMGIFFDRDTFDMKIMVPMPIRQNCPVSISGFS